MKIFVTGATGFIGSHFVNAAQDSGYEVIGLRRTGGEPRVKLSKEPIWVEGLLGDDFSETLKGCEILIHFASFGVSPQPADWSNCFYWNVLKSIDLLNQAINSGVKKIIISGTSAEYGEIGENYNFIPPNAPLKPVGAYSTSKVAFGLAAQSLCKESGVDLTYLRLFTVFGDGQYEGNLYPSLKKSALNGEDFPMTKGEQIRDFIHVEQVANKFVEELKFNNIQKGEARILNVGTGVSQSVLEFSEYWWRKWNAKGRLQVGAICYRDNEVMRYVPKI